jgi:hypothetical protein
VCVTGVVHAPRRRLSLTSPADSQLPGLLRLPGPQGKKAAGQLRVHARRRGEPALDAPCPRRVTRAAACVNSHTPLVKLDSHRLVLVGQSPTVNSDLNPVFDDADWSGSHLHSFRWVPTR